MMYFDVHFKYIPHLNHRYLFSFIISSCWVSPSSATRICVILTVGVDERNESITGRTALDLVLAAQMSSQAAPLCCAACAFQLELETAHIPQAHPESDRESTVERARAATQRQNEMEKQLKRLDIIKGEYIQRSPFNVLQWSHLG